LVLLAFLASWWLKKKENTMTRPTPLSREQRELRRTLRHVNRALKSNTLDLFSAATLIARLTNTLTRVHLADHHITSSRPSDLQTRFQSEIHRILIASGLGPNDLP